jgi:hypothetical protein
MPYKTPQGRLRETGARRVLELRAEHWTYEKIARELGVSLGTVFRICTGRTWQFLKEPAPT